MHSPGFLGRSVLKLLEKLLILGNSGKLLEKLEGRVIVSIAPDHSVSDELVDQEMYSFWISQTGSGGVLLCS